MRDSILEHNASTLPGSSGAPLVDGQGKVIGLHIGEYDDRSANQALPINCIDHMIKQRYCTLPSHVAIPVREEGFSGMVISERPRGG